jgi:ATP-dependent protease HslVU (ClpYQ) peptidase subunit
VTCVAGIAEGGRVYLGADSLVAAGQEVIQAADSKVWTAAGVFVVGVAGSAVWWDLMRDRVRWERVARGATSEQDFRRAITDEIRHQAKSDGIDFDDEDGGDSLVGVAGQLYRVDSYLTVQRVSERFCAIGSGAAPALGALYATARRGLLPKARLTKALTAAERYTITVRRPWRWASV